MAACAFALGPLAVIINSWPNRKLLNYPIRMQILDVLPTALVCCAEAAAVFGIDWIFKTTILQLQLPTSTLYPLLALELVLQFVLGLVTFLALSYVFKLQPMKEYMRMVKPFVVSRIPWGERVFSRVEM